MSKKPQGSEKLLGKLPDISGLLEKILDKVPIVRHPVGGFAIVAAMLMYLNGQDGAGNVMLFAGMGFMVPSLFKKKDAPSKHANDVDDQMGKITLPPDNSPTPRADERDAGA